MSYPFGPILEKGHDCFMIAFHASSGAGMQEKVKAKKRRTQNAGNESKHRVYEVIPGLEPVVIG